ncbi:transcriptional regulator, GntR family [Actinacidiphila yanglinensis]|uniref:Transcriptional regulator, GntR family n=1 Tax=Actinacidiphila yanglinensis TaxID=310779 RepID=A0A1H6DFT2_9ACTN|nr:GntR family transcriptional regulator [Actinacidiphila yanglinensis]SEG84228.1 transcriptional regulator, GntR family [Actinacidiphila yanglinensis]
MTSTGEETGAGAAVTQTYRRLSEALRRGAFPAGGRLPGERDLAGSLGVSRSTLRQALGRLAEEGKLERSSQRGWFVRANVVGEPPSTLQSFSEMARARGLRAQSRILGSRSRAATFEEAEQLGIAPAARVLELRRLRSLDQVPVCVDHSIIVLALASGLDALDLTDRSLYDTLEHECGLRIARSSYSVRAEAADEPTAELLLIEAGAPVLIGEEITYTEDGAPVLTGRMTYRSDAYRFQADLFRTI